MEDFYNKMQDKVNRNKRDTDKRNRRRKRNYINRAVILLVLLLIILVVLAVSQRNSLQGINDSEVSQDTMYEPGEYYNSDDISEDDDMADMNDYSTSAPLIKVNTDPASYTVLVNREYPMPEDYVPEDLTIPEVKYSYSGTYEKSYMRKAAAEALKKMFKEADEKKGFELKVVSAYRSYERQKAIYDYNVNTRGIKQTDLVSAKPGCSEHQTGLAIDISSDTVRCTIEESFASCPEGKWVAKNCHKFGFIIRYPKGKSDITGYSYEPWHIRYVGLNLAKYLRKKKLTLEEYYKTTTVDDKVPEDEYIKDTDVDAPDEPQMTAAPTPNSTAYVSTSEMPVPEPTDTPAPTIRPADTPEPETSDTPKPKETSKPTKTPKPTNKPKPEKTPKPTRTPKPEKTPKPTKVPDVTKGPEETKKPQNTQKPIETEKPAVTKVPENTTSPDETGSIQ